MCKKDCVYCAEDFGVYPIAKEVNKVFYKESDLHFRLFCTISGEQMKEGSRLKGTMSETGIRTFWKRVAMIRMKNDKAVDSEMRDF